MEWNFECSILDDDILSSYLNYQDINTIQPLAALNEKPQPKTRNMRLAKNRESARNSRKKKKAYLQNLESEVARLNHDISQLKLELAGYNLTQDSNFMLLYRQTTDQMLMELSQKVSQGASEQDLEKIINGMKAKRGVQGVERQGYIQYLLNQLVEIVIPYSIRCRIMENEQLESQLRQQGDYGKQLLRNITLKSSQFQNIVKRVKRIQKSLIRKQADLEEALDQLTSVLSYTQIAHILIRIHQLKKNEQSNGFDKQTDGL